TAAIRGSGWLGYNPSTKKLEVIFTPNQDPLLCKTPFPPHVPIIGIDISEHSYYLYHNVKVDYGSAIWSFINFGEAEARYVEAAK
ncbi:Manganese/iron superoxide dismutase, partial [Fomitopsis betulina]